MGQHSVELIITNWHHFYFAAEDDVSDEGGAWSGEAIIMQPQYSDSDMIVVGVFVDNMEAVIL